MSIETLIGNLIASLDKNTAALMGAKSTTSGEAGTASTTGTTSGKGGKTTGTKKDEPKGATVEEMQSALTEVKEKFGASEAKAIIESVGKVKKMADIPEGKVDAVFKAAKERLEAADETGGDEGDGL